MNKRIYILIVIALFGLASIWLTGNVVILILSILGNLVMLLMGNVDKSVFKTLGVGGLKKPPSGGVDDGNDDDNDDTDNGIGN